VSHPRVLICQVDDARAAPTELARVDLPPARGAIGQPPVSRPGSAAAQRVGKLLAERLAPPADRFIAQPASRVGASSLPPSGGSRGSGCTSSTHWAMISGGNRCRRDGDAAVVMDARSPYAVLLRCLASSFSSENPVQYALRPPPSESARRSSLTPPAGGCAGACDAPSPAAPGSPVPTHGRAHDHARRSR